VSIIEENIFSQKLGDVTAVDILNFQIAEGELFGLLGPNGARKTATVSLFCFANSRKRLIPNQRYVSIWQRFLNRKIVLFGNLSFALIHPAY
jgi:ABC-type branched-subunit amino acid transport system ATPase component